MRNKSSCEMLSSKQSLPKNQDLLMKLS